MTYDELLRARLAIEDAGWPGNGTGPWIDAMDHALRKHHRDHQFAIVGYAIGVHTTPVTNEAALAAWLTLLGTIEKRAKSVPEPSDPGYGRPIRPASVLPGYGQRRKR